MGNIWEVIELIIKSYTIIGAIVVFVILVVAVVRGVNNEKRRNDEQAKDVRQQVRYGICSDDRKCEVCNENIINKYAYSVDRGLFYSSNKYTDLCWRIYCRLPVSDKNYEFYEEFEEWRTMNPLFHEALIGTIKSLGLENYDDNIVSICENCFRSRER